jgi:hypothetical protein
MDVWGQPDMGHYFGDGELKMIAHGKAKIAIGISFFVLAFLIAGFAINGQRRSGVLPSRGSPEMTTGRSDNHSSVSPHAFDAPVSRPKKILTDNSEVIGVSIGVRHRAYPVQFLATPPDRVINDTIGETEVIVCSQPVRVLVRPPGSSKVQKHPDGASDGKAFAADSRELPLEEIAFSRTTWKEWRAAHPTGTVFGSLEIQGDDYWGIVSPEPGIHRPPVETAESAHLESTTPVIGIELAGHSRAYVTKALRQINHHVVNDYFANSAVTVTYCDLTDCVRAFTKADQQRPLDVSLYGLITGKMALNIDGQVVPQEAADVPLSDMNFVRTTWGEWKNQHPETDVLVGIPADGTGCD